MPENSFHDPASITYFTRISFEGKGFKIVDANLIPYDLSKLRAETQAEINGNDPFSSGTSYFFESSQYLVNNSNQINTNRNSKNKYISTVASFYKRDQGSHAREKIKLTKDCPPSFSRFYSELKNLKNTDPKMRSNISFAYFY